MQIRLHVLSLILLSLFIYTQTSVAQIYKWTDEKGKVHFSDQPPVQQPAESLKLRINTYKGVKVDPASFSSTKTVKSKKVVMYSTIWCGVCKKAKNYFRSKNISFTEYDIEKNQAARARFKKMGMRGVPVVLVGLRRMVGFSAAGFEQIYGN